jgi:hypothetical protein
MKCFCAYKCLNDSNTSLDPYYGDYGLKGRLNYNKFNIPLGLG